jgi:hypothetical protein
MRLAVFKLDSGKRVACWPQVLSLFQNEKGLHLHRSDLNSTDLIDKDMTFEEACLEIDRAIDE